MKCSVMSTFFYYDFWYAKYSSTAITNLSLGRKKTHQSILFNGYIFVCLITVVRLVCYSDNFRISFGSLINSTQFVTKIRSLGPVDYSQAKFSSRAKSAVVLVQTADRPMPGALVGR